MHFGFGPLFACSGEVRVCERRVSGASPQKGVGWGHGVGGGGGAGASWAREPSSRGKHGRCPSLNARTSTFNGVQTHVDLVVSEPQNHLLVVDVKSRFSQL